MSKKRATKPGPATATETAVAIIRDYQPEQLSMAEYMHKTALDVQSEAIKAALPELYKRLKSEADTGAMDTIIFTDDLSRKPLAWSEFAQFLSDHLRALGFKASVGQGTRRRLGMEDERVALIVSWRDAKPKAGET